MSSFVQDVLSSAAISSVVISDREQLMEQFGREVMCLVPVNHFYPAKFMIGLLDKYNAADLKRILLDFHDLKESIFSEADKVKKYIVTAGGPGAGKSTYLERFSEYLLFKPAYIDPDRSCLLNMSNTYLADKISGDRTTQEAYLHWREASNLLANVFLAYALDQGYAIAHGSTMADPRSISALEMIGGAYGYHRTVLHFTCEEGLRMASELKRREGGVVQCTDEDLVNKGKQFHERLEGYLKQSEDIIFLYRTDMDTVVEYARMQKGKFIPLHADLVNRAQKEHDAVSGEEDWNKVMK